MEVLISHQVIQTPVQPRTISHLRRFLREPPPSACAFQAERFELQCTCQEQVYVAASQNRRLNWSLSKSDRPRARGLVALPDPSPKPTRHPCPKTVAYMLLWCVKVLTPPHVIENLPDLCALSSEDNRAHLHSSHRAQSRKVSCVWPINTNYR